MPLALIKVLKGIVYTSSILGALATAMISSNDMVKLVKEPKTNEEEAESTEESESKEVC